MNLERDDERVLGAQTARAEAEAQRILHAALEQAAVLQVEMSREVEAQTQRRISMAEREIAERLAVADREAEERVRQSVDTAAAVLLNARKEADKVREELAAGARAEAEQSQRVLPAESGPVTAMLDEAEQAALARVSEADAFAEQRIAEAVKWCKQHIAEADQIGTQRLLDAETRAQEMIEQARAEVASLRLASDDPVWPEDRVRSGDEAPARALPDDAPFADDDATPAETANGGLRRFPRLVKTTRVVLLVVVAVMGTDLLRSCVAQPYTVASTSMEPEFHDGDRLVVNKLAYRVGDAGRGDIVIFDTSHLSGETSRLGDTLVKRVIGLPGEVVQAVDGQVMVNGELLDEPWLDDVLTPPFGPVQVPEDSLFLLGDDRVLSVDSRTFGPVPIDALVGKVEGIIWPPGSAGRV